MFDKKGFIAFVGSTSGANYANGIARAGNTAYSEQYITLRKTLFAHIFGHLKFRY